MIEAKVCLKLGSLSFSAWCVSEDFLGDDPLLDLVVALDLNVRALETLGEKCWKNFGMTGRQLMMTPVVISAYVHMPRGTT